MNIAAPHSASLGNENIEPEAAKSEVVHLATNITHGGGHGNLAVARRW